MIAPLQRQVHVHMHVNDTTTEGCDVTATDADPDTIHDGDTAAEQDNTSTTGAEDTQRRVSRLSSKWSDLFDIARSIKLDMAGKHLPTVPAPNGTTADLNQEAAVGHDETIATLDWILERSGHFAHWFGLHESRMQTLAARPQRLRT